jgi:hypothetical protein
MVDDQDDGYIDVPVYGETGTLLLGLLTCALCGHRMLSAFPADGPKRFECSRCWELGAEVLVAWPLGNFPEFDVRIRSRLAAEQAAKPRRTKES